MLSNLTGSLSSIINAVPAPDKMTIIPLQQTSPIPIPCGLPYIVQFNPENYDESMKIVFDQEQPIGSNSRHQHYNYSQPRSFTFDFLIDGTGASGDKREVIVEIELFKKTVEFKGEQHKPCFLLMIWGVHVVIATLTDLTINYSLFRKNGTPLRATLTATFVEHTDRLLQILKQNLLSSDLSSIRIVKEGDKLPWMCYGVYNNSRHYLEVAKANNLTNFRKLKVGSEIDFPPVDKN